MREHIYGAKNLTQKRIHFFSINSFICLWLRYIFIINVWSPKEGSAIIFENLTLERAEMGKRN